MRSMTMVAGAALVLSACSGGNRDNGGSNDAAASTQTSAQAPGTHSDSAKMKAWLADPCAMVGKDAVGAATGSSVTKSSGIPAKNASDADASCNYALDNGGFVDTDITYREGYFDSDEIASRRNIASGEDVSGVGDAAFWDPKTKQLTVFRGGAEQADFSLSPRGDADLKAMAIKLAKAAGY